jgi:two-component system, sensor histidine kinase and response regulator
MATILVMEPQSPERPGMREALEPAGHRVLSAGSTEQCLALLAERPPDVVVLDMATARAEALVLLGRLTSGPGALPVLVCSDTADPKARAELLRLGARSVLVCPYEPLELRRQVELLLQALGRQAPEDTSELHELRQFREDVADLLMNDLKIPLDVIMSNLKFLARELEEAPLGFSEALDDTVGAAVELNRIFSNLLDVRLAEQGNMPLFRTQVQVDELYQVVSEGRAREAELVGVRLEAEPTGLELLADPWVLQRVLENIIDNSLRFTPRGGRVVLRGERRGLSARLLVANTGPAIPPSVRGRLFDKLSPHGTQGSSPRRNLGLGLYFCRLAVRAHKGSISVEEHPDFPTVFALEFPLRLMRP